MGCDSIHKETVQGRKSFNPRTRMGCDFTFEDYA